MIVKTVGGLYMLEQTKDISGGKECPFAVCYDPCPDWGRSHIISSNMTMNEVEMQDKPVSELVEAIVYYYGHEGAYTHLVAAGIIKS